MSDIINMDDHRQTWSVLALCLTCMHKWAGSVLPNTSLFQLQCPQCGEFDSFATFIPEDYLHEFLKANERAHEH